MREGMISIDTKITKHINDVIQKYASGLFRDATLEFYGIKTAPIKELINPELPSVEVSGGAADVVFNLYSRSQNQARGIKYRGIGV
jgi:hypothetical protein